MIGYKTDTDLSADPNALRMPAFGSEADMFHQSPECPLIDRSRHSQEPTNDATDSYPE